MFETPITVVGNIVNDPPSQVGDQEVISSGLPATAAPDGRRQLGAGQLAVRHRQLLGGSSPGRRRRSKGDP